MAPVPAKTPHVLIVGAGIGGLVLAQCLRKKGVSYEIFERDASAEARGQGFAIGLHKLGDVQTFLPDDVPPVTDSCGLLPLPLPSQFAFYMSKGKLGVTDGPDTPCTRANRLRLRQILTTNLPVQWGKRLQRIEQEDDKATIWFADGTSASGDVVVGVDGTFSAVREHVLQKKNDEVLQAHPEAVILGSTVISGSAFERHLQLAHSGFVTFGRGFRLFVGLSHVLPDCKSAEYYWMVFLADPTIGDPDHWLKTATSGDMYKFSLEKVRELEPRFQEIVQLTSVEGMRGLVFWEAQLPQPPPSGRVILIGDAAHPVTPFRGEGGILAIKDAIGLSELLATADARDAATLKKSLADFQSECISRGGDAVALASGAMKKAAVGEDPMCWGWRSQPMEETPLGITIA